MVEWQPNTISRWDRNCFGWFAGEVDDDISRTKSLCKYFITKIYNPWCFYMDKKKPRFICAQHIHSLFWLSCCHPLLCALLLEYISFCKKYCWFAVTGPYCWCWYLIVSLFFSPKLNCLFYILKTITILIREVLRIVFQNSVVLWIPKWKKLIKSEYYLLFLAILSEVHIFFFTMAKIASTNSLLDQFEKRNSARNQFGKKLYTASRYL